MTEPEMSREEMKAALSRLDPAEVTAAIEQAPWPAGFPFTDPMPPPVMITQPCGCTSMDTGDDSPPVQVSWCAGHDPGYEP